jgi:hypothetical protein
VLRKSGGSEEGKNEKERRAEMTNEQMMILSARYAAHADELEEVIAQLTARRDGHEPVEEGPVEEPKTMKDVRGAERAIRKLLWRLKRLGISPEKVLVYGKETEYMIEDLL